MAKKKQQQQSKKKYLMIFTNIILALSISDIFFRYYLPNESRLSSLFGCCWFLNLLEIYYYSFEPWRDIMTTFPCEVRLGHFNGIKCWYFIAHDLY